MHATNVTGWVTLHGSAHKEVEVVVEVIVDVIEMVALDVVEKNVSSATNLGTLHVSARRIKIFAIVVTV